MLFSARTFFVLPADTIARVEQEQFSLVYHGHFTYEDTEIMSPLTRQSQLKLLVRQKEQEEEARQKAQREAQAKANAPGRGSRPPRRR